jgi:hypothetical protein
MNEQPEVLRLADALIAELPLRALTRMKSAMELRRLHQHELSNELWHEKTEWLQNSYTPAEIGLHRADVIKQRIDRLHSLNQELVEALEAWVELYNEPFYKDCPEVIKSRAALVKAKGEA